MSFQNTRQTLEQLFATNAFEGYKQLAKASFNATQFTDLLGYSNLRKKFNKLSKSIFADKGTVRIALLGHCNFYPFADLLDHCIQMHQFQPKFFTSDFNTFIQDVYNPQSNFYDYKAQVVFLIPNDPYNSELLLASQQTIEHHLKTSTQEILDVCKQIYQTQKCEIILCNFTLPAVSDPGIFRTKTLGSELNFKKRINTELGMSAPEYIHICDLEFLSARKGTEKCTDARGWFESKQLYSPDFMVDIVHEASTIISEKILLKTPSKKVIVLDLDHTLWGGVIGDDGLEGIELGGHSAQGEAFQAFQKYILSLQKRGFLLAVCSKNDHQKAIEPFQKHPEMILKEEHFVAFYANWNQKSDNLIAIAKELNLGLDSFIFIDDNPAEIEQVNQFTPDVSTILLSTDASEHIEKLANSKLFEINHFTQEDALRTQQYNQEKLRKNLLNTSQNLTTYLESLEMQGTIENFSILNLPRIHQLINKTNQFNLTTQRRTEQELKTILADSSHKCFSFRLSDKFGDHGLIAIVEGRIENNTYNILNILMSCRVLKRNVEDELFNEIFKIAKAHNCTTVQGFYVPSNKNQMVQNLYLDMGFSLNSQNENKFTYQKQVSDYKIKQSSITITRRSNESK